jgi:hypothetical protein
MSRDAKHAARWSTEGKEAEAILDLARQGTASTSSSEQAAKARFLLEFREHVGQRGLASGRTRWLQWRYAFAAAAALALLVAVFKFGTRYRGDALSYHSRSGVYGARFVQASQEPIQLDFSDGTVVVVAPSTSVRVTDTTRRGASFLLESGRMDFNVVPHPDRGSWLVQAGQFQVRVTGTVFSVEWVAAEGSLRVEVTRGHVIVEGAGQRRELGPGDSFHHQGSQALRASAAISAPIPDAPEARLDESAAAAPGSESASSGAPSAAAKPGSWSQWVAAGDFQKVLGAAAQRGVPGCLSGCSRDELWALANAARLGGKPALAEEAFVTQRRRFAGTTEAAAAAFLLGRLAEDRGDARALVWYDTYLKESPTGRFASDVLGRKMILVAKSDRMRALGLAEDYLLRFPQGPYAGHAKSLIDSASAIDGSKPRR